MASKQSEEPRFLNFPKLADDATKDGKPRLNKYSHTITNHHDFPGALVWRYDHSKDEAHESRQCFTQQAYQTRQQCRMLLMSESHLFGGRAIHASKSLQPNHR